MQSVLALVVGVATMFFTFWMGGALLSLLPLPDEVTWALAQLLSIVAAVLAGRAVWTYEGGEGLARSVATGAVLVGGIGFALGFFGPMILTPGANQGPLLGLFITGPLGAVAGGIGGALKFVRDRRAPAPGSGVQPR